MSSVNMESLIGSRDFKILMNFTGAVTLNNLLKSLLLYVDDIRLLHVYHKVNCGWIPTS